MLARLRDFSAFRMHASVTGSVGLLAAAFLLILAGQTQAQTVPEFYKGKQMEIITGGTPGSIYDHWSRALAHNMGKHIPGNPTFIVKNMPGGGHVTAANYIFNQSPRDGTVLGVVSRNMPHLDLLGNNLVRFKAREFQWIGSPELTNRACVAYQTAKVRRPADLFQMELVVGGSGAGSAVSTTPVILSKLLGMKLKLVDGYHGGPEIFLAMERGEVEGVCQTLAAIESTGPGWIEKGKLSILFNMEKDPLPGVSAPSVMSLTKTDEQREILSFYNSSAEMGRPVLTTPGLPPERLIALRRAFDATMRDRQFIAEAKKMTGLDVIAMTGEQVEGIAKRIAMTPKEIVDKTVSMIGTFGD